jgi:hypothetical protein
MVWDFVIGILKAPPDINSVAESQKIRGLETS